MTNVTVINPIDASYYLEIASGERAGIAYLLARLARDHLAPLVVVEDGQEMPATRFIAQMYGTGQVSMKATIRSRNTSLPAKC